MINYSTPSLCYRSIVNFGVLLQVKHLLATDIYAEDATGRLIEVAREWGKLGENNRGGVPIRSPLGVSSHYFRRTKAMKNENRSSGWG